MGLVQHQFKIMDLAPKFVISCKPMLHQDRAAQMFISALKSLLQVRNDRHAYRGGGVGGVLKSRRGIVCWMVVFD